MALRRCIGLLLLLQLPSGERAALLRVRGRIDPQTGKRETFAGVSQVTVHGSAAETEDLEDALRREVVEELTEMLRVSGIVYEKPQLHALVIRHLPRSLTLLSRKETPDMTIVTLGGLIKDSITVAALRPLLRCGQLRLIREADLQNAQMIDPDDPLQRMGSVPEGNISMFPDEMEALKKAFSETFV